MPTDTSVPTEAQTARLALRRARAGRDLTQAALAEIVSATRGHIAAIEGGTRLISRGLASRVATVLGIPLADLEPIIGAGNRAGIRARDVA